MNTWSQIQKLIEDKKLTKVTFAKKMGISRGTVDNWIKGPSSPTQKDMDNMLKILSEMPVKSKKGSFAQDSNVPDGFEELINEMREVYKTNALLKDELIEMQKKKILELEAKVGVLESELKKYKKN
jgi:transcriptional regulator with XRE-family HTH domain